MAATFVPVVPTPEVYEDRPKLECTGWKFKSLIALELLELNMPGCPSNEFLLFGGTADDVCLIAAELFATALAIAAA